MIAARIRVKIVPVSTCISICVGNGVIIFTLTSFGLNNFLVFFFGWWLLLRDRIFIPTLMLTVLLYPDIKPLIAIVIMSLLTK